MKLKHFGIVTKEKWFYLKRWARHHYERHTKGFSFQDRWCLSWFISDLLARALTEFRDSPHDEGPASLNGGDNWDKQLTIMIEGFEAAKEISEHIHTDELDKKFDLGMKAFKKYYFHLWT